MSEDSRRVPGKSTNALGTAGPSYKATISITPDDIRGFAAASGDVSSVHVSDQYARQTPFGSIIAHGVLTILRALEVLPPSPTRVRALTMSFLAPALPFIEYKVSHAANEAGVTVEVRDGHRLISRVRVKFEPDQATRVCEPLHAEPQWPRDFPEPLFDPAAESKTRQGSYWPDWRRLRSLLDLNQLLDAGLDYGLIAGALCGSYVVGMELPGESALLRSLSISTNPGPVISGPLHFSAETAPVRLGLLDVQIAMASSVSAGISGQATAFIRSATESEDQTTQLNSELSGRTAVIIGGSRGFGRAMAESFASRGCRTYATSRFVAADPLDVDSGEWAPVHIQCDIDDSEQVARLGDTIRAQEADGIDYLVLCATSPLHALWLDADHLDRVQSYISNEIALTLRPLFALMPLLEQAQGRCILASSQGLQDLSQQRLKDKWRDWPHYLAAKAATEVIWEVAGSQYPSVQFSRLRLPPMRTALVLRSSVANEHAHPPREVADQIVERLAIGDAQELPYEDMR